MKILACVSALGLAACTSQAGPNNDSDYPVLPSGGEPTTASAPGAGVTSGHACVLADARSLSACAPSGAGGMTVTVDGAPVATTAADGSFTFPQAPDESAMIGITGPGMVPTQALASTMVSLTPTTATSPGFSVPVVREDLFTQMAAANGITTEAGSGSILGSVIHGTTPAMGVTVASTPTAAFGPFFDGSTPTAWTLDGTGERGVVWVPGVTAGPTNLTFMDVATSGSTSVDGVQVLDGGVTIVDAVLP